MMKPDFILDEKQQGLLAQDMNKVLMHELADNYKKQDPRPAFMQLLAHYQYQINHDLFLAHQLSQKQLTELSEENLTKAKRISEDYNNNVQKKIDDFALDMWNLDKEKLVKSLKELYKESLQSTFLSNSAIKLQVVKKMIPEIQVFKNNPALSMAKEYLTLFLTSPENKAMLKADYWSMYENNQKETLKNIKTIQIILPVLFHLESEWGMSLLAMKPMPQTYAPPKPDIHDKTASVPRVETSKNPNGTTSVLGLIPIVVFVFVVITLVFSRTTKQTPKYILPPPNYQYQNPSMEKGKKSDSDAWKNETMRKNANKAGNINNVPP